MKVSCSSNTLYQNLGNTQTDGFHYALWIFYYIKFHIKHLVEGVATLCQFKITDCSGALRLIYCIHVYLISQMCDGVRKVNKRILCSNLNTDKTDYIYRRMFSHPVNTIFKIYHYYDSLNLKSKRPKSINIKQT